MAIATAQSEKRLLMLLEDCSVMAKGLVPKTMLNTQDILTVNRWKHDGYLEFGHIAAIDNVPKKEAQKYFYCRLGPDAFNEAGELRRQQAERCWNQRAFQTMDEALIDA